MKKCYTSPKLEELRHEDDPYAEEYELPSELLDSIAKREFPAGLFEAIRERKIPVDQFTIKVSTIIRFERRYDRIEIYAVTPLGGGIWMSKQISLMPGESKRIEVHGFTADGIDVGVVPAKISGSDNHTIQVSDKGDGTGTVLAVGAAGSSADILADDGQGHTDTAHGTIETPQGPIIARIEIVEVMDAAPVPGPADVPLTGLEDPTATAEKAEPLPA